MSTPTKKRKIKNHGEFKLIQAEVVLPVPPVFGQDLRKGVLELLDSLLMRYDSSLEGVVLAHQNLDFVSKNARIIGDNPFAVCTVRFDATTWAPRQGMKLIGKVSVCSPDHISLLVHRTFNVSIPRHHIPDAQYAFEPYAEPEMVEDDDALGNTHSQEDMGRWIDKSTNEAIQDSDGNVEFTVIGLTVANEMLSLVGSIQPDPFSDKHVPQHTTLATSRHVEIDGVSDTSTAAVRHMADDISSMYDTTDIESEGVPPIIAQEKAKKKKKRKKESLGDTQAPAKKQKKSSKKPSALSAAIVVDSD